jgi:hypothetical protein
MRNAAHSPRGVLSYHPPSPFAGGRAENSEFGIRNDGQPPVLNRRYSPNETPALPFQLKGRAGIQNSEFKIQNSCQRRPLRRLRSRRETSPVFIANATGEATKMDE